jgi:hypothetical protein
MDRVRRMLALLPIVPLTAGILSAETAGERVVNPCGRPCQDEAVRLRMDIPAGDVTIREDGQEVPFQLDTPGDRRAWVLVTLPAADRDKPHPARTYTVGPGKPAKREKPAVRVAREGDTCLMDNGIVAIRVPMRAEGSTIPPPVLSVRLPNDTWAGRGSWRTARKFKGLDAEVTGDGTVFGRVTLVYRFDGKAGLNGDVDAFARVDVSLFPGQQHAAIEESHEMDRGDHWEFDVAAGWTGRDVLTRPIWGGFPPSPGPDRHPRSLQPAPDTHEAVWKHYVQGETRLGDTLIRLIPRWSQHYEYGWYFAVADTNAALGAIVCRAGKWVWPHNNDIAVKLKPAADYAGLRCPTWKGRRYWYLLAGPRKHFEGNGPDGYVQRFAMESLNKLHNEYILEWEGKTGLFQGEAPFSGNINPTGGWRGFGRNEVASAGRPGGYGEWIRAQVLLDYDLYGTYYTFWSPENPNFFSDHIKPALGMTTKLKEHPRFEELRRKAEARLREDVDHSVTLPGGAGQECPGYLKHGIGAWRQMAPMCREHLGFDPASWPRVAAAESFLVHASAPDGNGGRFSHPGGDTHPPGPKVTNDVSGFATEELPGFGVIFRNRPGSADETYLAFKSGPNRGHYHGDQLSLHYAAHGRLVAVDHHCSYSPRAGQEHMHNRVAFAVPGLPHANMDGYERLVAFKTSADVDAAIGQVESDRLRAVTNLPPEVWNQGGPVHAFPGLLKYRRTVVSVKNAAADYVVLRDQFESPDPVTAVYCLHAYGSKAEQAGRKIQFDGLALFCADPAAFTFERLDWQHSNGGLEATRGVRLSQTATSGQFITVLYPSSEPPAVETVAAGVRIGSDVVTFGGGLDDAEASVYVTVERAGKPVLTLTGRDIDMDRSQGDIGLFVPDAGYPFGEIPDWLIRQRVQANHTSTP